MHWNAKFILYLIIFSGSGNHVIRAKIERQHLEDDFSEMEWLLERNEARFYNIRLERSPDYGAGLGGPLAAHSGPEQGKPTPAPGPAPITAPKTTAAPGPAPITAPSDKGRPAPGGTVANHCKTADSLSGIVHDEKKGNSTTAHHNRGPDIKTDFVIKKKTVLKAIQDGEDKPNDYLSLKTVACSDNDKCREACNREGCNYFLSYYDRDKSPLAFMYSIHEDILANRSNYVESQSFNSYVIIYHKNQTHAPTSAPALAPARLVPPPSSAESESQKSNQRHTRQTPFCYVPPCSIPALASLPANAQYCAIACAAGGGGGGLNLGTLIALVLALALGLGIGLGVGVGAGAGAPIAAGIAAGARKAAAARNAQAAERAQSASQFKSWTETYSKTYESTQKYQQAQQCFEENQKNMAKANKQFNKTGDAKQGNTKFSDLNLAAFTGFYTGALTDGPIQPIPFQPSLTSFIPVTDTLPKMHWESAAESSLPPIRYQGKCGACYAFAAADLVAAQNSIERRRVLKDVPTQELSVQYMVDCGGTNASVGCHGGRPAVLLKNVQNSEGVPFESCYPYKEEAGTSCENLKADKCCERHKVKFSQLIDITGPNEKEIFANILNWGPVIAIVGVNEQWMFYNGSGVIKASQCDPKVHNHAVIISGYHYNQTDTPIDYYSVRNSWGTDWGTNGYAKLEAGKNTCGVAKYILVTCTGDCRNVTSVKDLINRSNVPNKYQEEHSRNATSSLKSSSSSKSLSSSSSKSSSSSSSSSSHKEQSNSSSNQQKAHPRTRK